MKIGLIYTSTTPELIALVEQEVHTQIGADAALYSLEDPSILADIREEGVVTALPAARLVSLYMQAVQEGCDALLNVCSSVGEVADSTQDLARYLGVPLVRIDEEMCREAVRKGSKIAIMATLPTTLAPTKNTVQRVAREMGRQITLVECLVENAFGLNPTEFLARMQAGAASLPQDVEVILFAQGSMAYCEQPVADATHKTVLSSPRFGAAALREALLAKGIL